MPNTPQRDDGILIEPPPSEPMCREPRPSAAEAAAPPLEPPGVRSGSHGLRHGSPSLFSVVGMMPNSGVFVLPMMMAPACRSLATSGVSVSGVKS